MPNELEIPSDANTIRMLVKDVSELKRKARIFDEAEPVQGCCTSYCCLDGPGDTLSVGEFEDWCITEPDPVGGEGLRIRIDGWVKFTATGGAPSLRACNVTFTLNATTYVGTPGVGITMNAGDYMTFPIGITIDSPVADPLIAIRTQNVGVGDITILEIYSTIETGPTHGSILCGETGQ